MDTKHLHTFLTASKTLNFTKTAKILDYAQSSITAQIKLLEEELDAPLFERLGKRLYLTEAGKELQQYAEKMIKLDEEMRNTLRGEKDSKRTLAIGAQESQCTYRLPSILHLYRKKYPQVDLIFKPVHSSDVARDYLQTDILDIAFITDIERTLPTIHKELLLQEDLKLVASPAHRLVSNVEVKLSELNNETLLLTEKGCSYRVQFENRLNAEGIQPVNLIEFVSVEAIKQCVMANLGISVLPAMAVKNEMAQGKLFELKSNIQIEPILTQMAWHKDKQITPHLEDFIDIVRRCYGN